MEDTEKAQIDAIMRQTDYDYDKSKSKLIEFNFNYEKVIKDYMGITDKNTTSNTCSTSNQQRYKMIRHAMDTQMKNYEEKKG